MSIQIQQGDATDITAAVNVMIEARQQRSIPPMVHSAADVHAYFNSHLQGDAELIVAEESNTIVGMLVLASATVEQLYVHPPMQGRGVGSSLLRRAKQARPTGLHLWTFVSNTAAQTFYLKHGFTEVRRSNTNEERAPAILYQWR